MKRSYILLGVFALLLFIALPFMANDDSSTQAETTTSKTNTINTKQDDQQMKEIRVNRIAREFVLANLKDPDSASFRNQRGFCGEVNAKNSFGGYTGFKRFMATDKNLVIMESDLKPDEFQRAWDQVCE